MKSFIVVLIVAAGLASPFPSTARADQLIPSPGASPFLAVGNGATTSASLAARFGQTINPKSDFGALGNAQSFAGGTMTAGSNTLASSAATFTAADVGKSIVVDYAGAAGAPLVTTISGFVSSSQVTLAANASNSVPFYFAVGANPGAPGTGCAAGNAISYSGGTSTTTAAVTVTNCQVVTAAVNAGGSGGHATNGATSGACVVTGTTGAGGPPFGVNVTLTAGAITSIGSFTNVGNYSTNPTSLSAEPVVGCNGLSGASLALTLGVRNVRPTTKGVYGVTPANPIAQGSASGSEAGVSINGLWAQSGTFTYGTDDTAAFTAAWNASISAWAAGNDNCIEIPAGHYFLSGAMPIFYAGAGVPGCIRGTDRRKTLIYVSPAMSGDLFSWSRSFNFSQDPFAGPSEAFSKQNTGPSVSHLAVYGDRTTLNQQNAFMFYDENEYVTMDDIEVGYLNGRGIGSGIVKNSPNAYIQESWFSRLRLLSVGNASSPVIDIGGIEGAGGQPPNELRFDVVDIYGPYGQGVWMRNGSANFRKLRVEGTEWDSNGANTDLLEIGDPASTIAMQGFSCLDCELIDPYVGAAALHMAGSATTPQSYNLRYDGLIGGGAPLGRGIQIDYGRTSSFNILATIGTWDYAVQLGAAGNVGSDIDIETQAGEETSLTYNLGSGSTQSPTARVLRKGVLGGAVVANNHDGSAAGGTTPGTGAVDMSTTRTSSGMIASGQASTIAGGQNNAASGFAATVGGGENNTAGNTDAIVAGGNTNGALGPQSFVGGGFVNTAGGASGWIPGGRAATDRSRYGAGCVASGVVNAGDYNGDAQHCWMALRGETTSSSAIRLTSDQLAAGSADCVNIPSNTLYLLTLDIAALDRTNPANNETWSLWSGKMYQTSGAANTFVAMQATPTPLASGAVTGSGITASADTTNGCLNLTFTPPTSNTDTWDVVARVTTVEVQ